MRGYLVYADVAGMAGLPPLALINASVFSQTSTISMFSLTLVFISSLVSRRIRPDKRNFSISSLSYGIAAHFCLVGITR